MFSFLPRFNWPPGWSPRLTDHLSSNDITWANGLFVIWSEGKKLYVMETTLREIWLPRGCLHLPLHFLATINPREEVWMRNVRNRWELQPLAKRVNFWQHFQQLYIMILVLFFHVLSCTMHICLMLKYRSKAGLLISGCPPLLCYQRQQVVVTTVVRQDQSSKTGITWVVEHLYRTGCGLALPRSSSSKTDFLFHN